ncbi:glycosyltransferase family 4 protein [Citreimonas salinaria]|uniref:Glycosyltransferase involved in cell wall bisynthesis n=1 Tax=Citreimonas salinaria TaxID=321339 RepID=A0A1H3FZP6_9RHOB|nr:glycosyltransferase [Citreimonas salinaria]SDX95579.1 Glycosyltransferase involved in cell wall bisynthesis [Citreimonas salinaria]
MQAGTVDRRPRVLLLADDFNPEWPSLPVVGYKYARALSRVCDVTVATHVRNRPNVEAAGPPMEVVYLDNEWIAAPMHRLATRLRGGDQVAWSTSMAMGYLPYLAFERAAWQHFRAALHAGRFDLVHRMTPMTPTMPSWIARRLPVPFVLGPLNGNLDWPRAFAAEQARERERLRALRGLYRVLPYARSTYDSAAAVLCAFEHTRTDLAWVEDARIVPFPEIGFDADLFHAGGAAPAGARDPQGRLRFLFAGRLVPYKLPELPVLAFARHPALRAHRLVILGDGPERPRIEALIAEHGLQDCVTLHGRTDQAGVANWMRNCDAFVFPSIRELGAGVVIEAMASGMDSIVTDYGAPGWLADQGRGITVPMAPLDTLVDGFAQAMLDAADDRAGMAARAETARRFAEDGFIWDAKAARTRDIYEAVLSGAPLQGLGY